jgi:chitodextrinase
MQSLHVFLKHRYKAYADWHHSPRHPYYHWALFISVGLLLTNVLYTNIDRFGIILPPDLAQAAVDPTTEPLIQLTDLVYQGSFAVPHTIPPGCNEGLNGGGKELAYNPINNSLFIVGNDQCQFTSELNIPSTLGQSYSSLPVTSFRQNAVDALEGQLTSIGVGGSPVIGGQLVYNGRLYISAYASYNGGNTQQTSHFIRPLNLSTTGQLEGPYRISPLPIGMHDAYFGLIPAEWRTLLGGPVLNGNCCISIIALSSFGPALFSMDPTHVGVSQDASPLLYYPDTHKYNFGLNAPAGAYMSELMTVGGLAFPNGTRSVLFVGRTGLTDFCYGTGTTDHALDHTLVSSGSPEIYCYDPEVESHGGHASSYGANIWAYDANDLAAVKAGTKNPWDVQPYANWQFAMPFGGHAVSSAAYDPDTSRLFVAQQYGVGSWPIIHVYKINTNTPADTTPPSQPTNLTAVADSSSVTLSWNSSTDNFGLAGYKIYHSGNSTPFSTANSNSFAETNLSPSSSYSYSVAAYDYSGNISAMSNTFTIQTSALNSAQGVFGTQVPSIQGVNTAPSWELGTKIVSDTAGQITAIRFWKALAENSPHVGHIWSSSGQLLSTVTFSNETASGWQQQTLNTPLDILANTEYDVTVGTGPNGYFVLTTSAFVNGITRGHLQVPAGNSGLYGSLGVFPTTGGPNNYFRDIIFVPGSGSTPTDTTAPTVPTNLSATAPSSTQVNLTWTASTDAVGVLGYRVYRGGNLLNSTNTTSYTDNTVTASNPYSYTVLAYDAVGNSSAQSTAFPITTPAVIDTTPPTLSSILSSGITTSAATITWTTDESSDSLVEYGLTTGYGLTTTLNTSLVLSHTVSLSGLTPNTTYHYRVKSKDSATNLATSTDNTFLTPQVTSNPAPIATLTASPSSLTSGSSSTLTWSTTNATSVSINQSIGTVATSGSRTVNPTVTTTYTLTATGLGGSITSVATVTITAVITPTPPPVIIPGVPTVSISSSDYTASESQDNGTFTISRSSPSDKALVVNITTSGTAVNGGDYSTISSTATIPANSTSTTLTVNVLDDSKAEPTETVIITLGTSPNYNLGSPASVTISITDNDGGSVTPTPTTPLTPSEISDRYPDGLIFKYPDNPTVYVVDQGKQRPITDLSVLQNNVPPSRPIVTIPTSVSLPIGDVLGLKDGTIIKSNDDPTIYAIINGSKRAFTSQEEFTSLGYNLNEIQSVDTNAVNAIPTTTEAFTRPSGTLFKYASDPTVYFLYQGQKRGYPSLNIFLSWNESLLKVATIPDSEVYPDGSVARLPNGMLVKGSSPAVYIISQGTLRPFASSQVFTDLGYSFNAVVNVADSDLRDFGVVGPIQ